MAAIAGIGARLTGNTAGWTAALNSAQQAGRAYVQATQAAMAAATGAVAASTRAVSTNMAQQDAAMRRSAAVTEEAARRRAAATRGFSSNGMGGAAGQGGSGPGAAGGGNVGYKAGVAYNFVQDAAQGGIAGIANNIPQVIQMLGPLGVAIGALGGSLVALGAAVKYAMFTSDTAEDFARRRQQEENRQIAVARQQRKEGVAAGSADGDAGAKGRRDLISGVLETRAMADRKAANEKLIKDEAIAQQRAAIERMEDEEARIKALAKFDLEQIDKTTTAAVEAAQKRADEELVIQKKLQADLAQLKAQAAALDNNRTKSDAAALREQARVVRELAAVQQLSAEAAARVTQAQVQVDAAKTGQQVGQLRKEGVAGSAEADLNVIAKKKAEEADEAAGEVFDTIRDGLRRLAEDAKEATDRRRVDQGKQAILREIAIQELRSRGDNKRAEELEKAAMREQRIEQLQKANFTKEEATALADREAATSRRRGVGKFGKRVKGAVSKNRASGIDGEGLTDAFDFDAFQAEGIPGFKEATTQKKKIQGAGKKDAQNTKPPTEKEGTGTQRIEALLADLINVTKGRRKSA